MDYQGARALKKFGRYVLPGKVYNELTKSDIGVHGWLDPQVKKQRLLKAGLTSAGAAAAGAAASYAYNSAKNYISDKVIEGIDYLNPWTKTKMAPLKRKMASKKRRFRTIPIRRYRKATPRRRFKGRRRSYRKKLSPLQRAIRKTSKRIKMGHYRAPNMYRKVCDVVNLESYLKCPFVATGDAEKPYLAKYNRFTVDLASLPNLQNLLNENTFGDFQEFIIDKVVVKVVVKNARMLSMDPNYKAPDGHGTNQYTSETTMAHPEEYAAKNSYVFHKRYERDTQSSGDFTDWSLFQYAQRGAITYTNFFRQKGRMFDIGCFTTKLMDIEYAGSSASISKKGQPLGWMNKETAPSNLKVADFGIIMPGIAYKGWDKTNINPNPELEVSCRVCARVRNSAFSIDKW